MATIKGQNLRLKINDRCVAGATSCAVHIAAQTEDTSTKDDTGDWVRVEVTGLSWDAQADALVLLGDAKPVQRTIHYGDTPIHRLNETFTLHPGEVIADVTIYQADEVFEYSLQKADTHEVLEVGFLNSTDDDIDVDIFITPIEPDKQPEATIDATVSIDNLFGGTLSELYARMRTKKTVDVSFNRTKGVYNRETEQEMLQGKALITDLSINAGNRQNASWSCKLTGTGELYTVHSS